MSTRYCLACPTCGAETGNDTYFDEPLEQVIDLWEHIEPVATGLNDLDVTVMGWQESVWDLWSFMIAHASHGVIVRDEYGHDVKQRRAQMKANRAFMVASGPHGGGTE